MVIYRSILPESSARRVEADAEYNLNPDEKETTSY